MKNTKYDIKFNKFKSLFHNNHIKDITNLHIEELDKLEKKYLFYFNQIKLIEKEMENKKLKTNLHKQILQQLNKISNAVEEVANYILMDINKKYNMQICYRDIVNSNEKFYYKNGTLATIKKIGIIEKVFENYLLEVLPKHPKDEYPLARELKRHFIIHTGETNSGKTYNSILRLKDAKNGLYLAPLRLLALEVYEDLNSKGIACNLSTGEEKIEVPFAEHTSSTVEKADYKQEYDVVVIDECQMISDSYRGHSWTKAILGIRAEEIHLICSPSAVELLSSLIEECDDTYEIIRHERSTPLIIEDKPYDLAKDITPGDAFITFSRKSVLNFSSYLKSLGHKVSVIYGSLPPESRRKQVSMFINKETDVLVSTDAIGMGLNLPIQRIIFLETTKFDGTSRRSLNTQEIKQIAGRAGRKGLYEQGYVNTLENKELIRNQLYRQEPYLTKAYISPSDNVILGLPFGTIIDRLEAWNDYIQETNRFKKTDLSVQVLLLELLAEAYPNNELKIEEEFAFSNIPFNHKNDKILKEWFNYIDEYLASGKTSLPYIDGDNDNLDNLEEYYQLLNLYYSINMRLSLDFDVTFIYDERMKVAEKIHNVLLEKSIDHTCATCGAKMEWNQYHNNCDNCFQKQRKYMRR